MVAVVSKDVVVVVLLLLGRRRVTFLHFEKNVIMFCFVLFYSFGNRSESYLFE